jgi:hypothetical protein
MSLERRSPPDGGRLRHPSKGLRLVSGWTQKSTAGENEKGLARQANPLISLGGAGGSRTPYLLNAIQALFQLSYSPAVTLFM